MRIVLAALAAIGFSLIEYGLQAFPQGPFVLGGLSVFFAGLIVIFFKGAAVSSSIICAVAVTIVLGVLMATPEVEPVRVMLGLWLGFNAFWANVFSEAFMREAPHASTEQ